MENQTYLAMTAAEFAAVPSLPPKIAWMACHFSPYGTGLCGMPDQLPGGSVLILNDRIPLRGHDPTLICQQLAEAVERNNCAAVLADFQKPHCEAYHTLADLLTKQLTVPVPLPPEYAQPEGPVFLPPVPADTALPGWLEPWQGRDIWLELSSGDCGLLLTQKGTQSIDTDPSDYPLTDPVLHVHYRIEDTAQGIVFQFHRTDEDLTAVVEEALQNGAAHTVGLYQELKEWKNRSG